VIDMHPNAELVTKFYEAFGRRDAEGMVACYAPDVVFSDPVFPNLRGAEAGAMWRMLCERGKDLRVEASGIDADDREGRAHWDAYYTFSATGKKVHNVIDARFEFRDGRIARHTDTFDLTRWAGMALGLKGKLLGWAPPVQNAIRKQADAGLRAWMKKNA
jgi:ketosteroid isomerase-like protein